MAESTEQALLGELAAIKKLLMLQLLAVGFKQKDLAATLEVSEATLSRMLPKGITKDLPRGTSADG